MTSHVDLSPLQLNITEAMQSLSAPTQRAYRRWTVRFLADTYQVEQGRFNLQRIRLDILTAVLKPQYLEAWLRQLQAQKLSASTLLQARCAILWLAQTLATQTHASYLVPGALAQVPTPPALDNPRPKTWLTQEELARLLEAALRMETTAAHRARNLAMLLLLVECGLRREEVCAARWEDLMVEHKQLFLLVRGKARKRRLVLLPAQTAKALQAWRRFHPAPFGENPIFVQIALSGISSEEPLSGQSVMLLVKEAAAGAGLGDLSPHDLRRSYARNAYEAGMDYEQLRQSLGHESAGTTQRYLGMNPRRHV